VRPWMSLALYVAVALTWFVPDRRFERLLAEDSRRWAAGGSRARGRPRHSHRPGTTRPSGCQHHDDLHPRPQPRPHWGPEPRRPDVPLQATV